jgi:arylsulfatase A-like enzyme
MRSTLHAIVLATALATACDRGLPRTIAVEDVVVDLDRRPPDAHDAGVAPAVLAPGDPLRGDGARPGLAMPPGTAARWRVTLPAHPTLRFALGVVGDGRRDEARSAVRFTVAVDGHVVFTRDVNPAATRRDRRWFDEEIALPVFAGQPVELTLATALAGGDGVAPGAPGWSRIRIAERTEVPREPAAPDRPNVLVIVVDTLRADAVGPRGDLPSATPALDALAARGLSFAQAVSQSSWTLPSVASLMTGLPPRTHGALGQDENAKTTGGLARWGVLGDDVLTWAEVATRAGVSTIGVSSNPLISRGTNLAQGFETFVELPWDPEGRDWPRARDVNDAFVTWLRRNRSHRFVGYLHYMEPHDPYTPATPPPAPAGVRPAVARGWVQEIAKRINWERGTPLAAVEVAHLRERYRAEVADWDRAFGELRAALGSLGVAERTLIVVTADHGEEFQEHGRLKHGSHLYEETVRVPLVLAGPDVPSGRRDHLVQGIDLFPTVVEAIGASPPAGLAGRSLLAEPAERTAILETATGIAPDGHAIDLTAVRTARWKLIETPALPRSELYDLVGDPGEARDRSDAAPERAPLAEALATWRAVTPEPTGAGSADLGDKLRALGYVR